MTSTEIIEKNKLNTDSVWVKLLEVVIPNSDTVYLCDTNDNIIWNGITHLQFPFSLPEIQQSSDGSVKEVSITLSNVRRVIGNYISDYDLYRKNGGTDNIIVKLRIVNTDNLTNLNPIMWTFKVLSFRNSGENTVLTVGGDNIVNRQFPFWRMTRMCQWTFKDANTCQYVGSGTTCDKTLTQCKEYSNTINFGGFLSLTSQGIRY